MNEGPAVVIMAGGAGTRFWPASTERCPKQFLRLIGDQSLLEQSHSRALLLTGPERIIVLTNEAFVPLVREQLPSLATENIIGEPARRDTAAAVCLGALLCRHRFGDCVMVVLTADHVIGPAAEFERCVASAVRAAAGAPHGLYTFGIPPTQAATGYGYLQRGSELLDDAGVRHYRLERFHEKPQPQQAAAYLREGGFYWNSGMFVWRVQAVLEEFERHLPRHVAAVALAVAHDGSPAWPAALSTALADLEAVSVDVGILERAGDVRMVEATFGWSDLGGWVALAEFLPADGAGNHHQGRLMARDASGNVVFAEDGEELVALIGVDDLVVVRAGRRTLVSRRDRVEEIKQVVQGLADAGYGGDL